MNERFQGEHVACPAGDVLRHVARVLGSALGHLFTGVERQRSFLVRADTEANITRRAKDAAEALHREDVWAEIVKRLRVEERSLRDFAGVHVGPAESGDIPDNDQARLVILHPKFGHKRRAKDSVAFLFGQQATERRGTANRTNRNMVVFLAPDEDRLAELDQSTRTYLAWKAIVEKSNELNLTPQQLAQAAEKRDQASRTMDDRIPLTYQWVLNPTSPVPGAPFEIEEIKTDGQSVSLANRVAKKLGSAGAFSVQHSARSIRLSLDEKVPAAWAAGHVSVGSLWGLYAQYPYMPRLRSREVLVDALDNQPLIWQSEGFALADGYNPETKRYSGLWLPGEVGRSPITDATLVVQPDRAENQRAAEKLSRVPADDDPDENSTVTKPSPTTPQQVVPSKPTARRFVGSAPISGERYAGDFAKIAAEVIANLAGVPGVKLVLNVSIDAVAPGGFTEQEVRTIHENATTLKFTTNEFESD